jgi:hypothetical protein
MSVLESALSALVQQERNNFLANSQGWFDLDGDMFSATSLTSHRFRNSNLFRVGRGPVRGPAN